MKELTNFQTQAVSGGESPYSHTPYGLYGAFMGLTAGTIVGAFKLFNTSTMLGPIVGFGLLGSRIGQFLEHRQFMKNAEIFKERLAQLDA